MHSPINYTLYARSTNTSVSRIAAEANFVEIIAAIRVSSLRFPNSQKTPFHFFYFYMELTFPLNLTGNSNNQNDGYKYIMISPPTFLVLVNGDFKKSYKYSEEQII